MVEVVAAGPKPFGYMFPTPIIGGSTSGWFQTWWFFIVAKCGSLCETKANVSLVVQLKEKAEGSLNLRSFSDSDGNLFLSGLCRGHLMCHVFNCVVGATMAKLIVCRDMDGHRSSDFQWRVYGLRCCKQQWSYAKMVVPEDGRGLLFVNIWIGSMDLKILGWG